MPLSGRVAAGTQISLTTTSDGAIIHYTVDGTEPTVLSTVYSVYTPITINANTIIQAVAVKDAVYSGIMTASYTISSNSTNVDECFIATAAFGSKFMWPVLSCDSSATSTC